MEANDKQKFEGTERGSESFQGSDDRLSTSVRKERTFNKSTNIARIVIITLFIVLAIYAVVNFDLPEIQAFIEQNQNLAFIISLLVMFFTSLTLIPTLPLTLLLLVILGPTISIIISAVGNTIAAVVHYEIGKQVGDIFHFEEKKAGLPFNLGKLPADSLLFLLIGRVIPGGPKGLSFICGLYYVPYFLYIWTTFAMNLITSALAVLGGVQLIKL